MTIAAELGKLLVSMRRIGIFYVSRFQDGALRGPGWKAGRRGW
ncbi:hypothetical protein [Burkholderia gladioli]|nr:hypothetical protein [Burkholderia gladioli]